SLYRSSDGVRGRGAAVKYLAHNPSRNAGSVWLIPLHSGTRHSSHRLGPPLGRPQPVGQPRSFRLMTVSALPHLSTSILARSRHARPSLSQRASTPNIAFAPGVP